jgi:hypothetical protein
MGLWNCVNQLMKGRRIEHQPGDPNSRHLIALEKRKA